MAKSKLQDVSEIKLRRNLLLRNVLGVMEKEKYIILCMIK